MATHKGNILAIDQGPTNTKVLLVGPAGQIIAQASRPLSQTYPRPAWVEFRAKLLALPMEADNFRRLYLGSAMDVEIDSGSRAHLEKTHARHA